MIKMDIRQFMSTQHYGSLLERQDATRRREIDIETQARELRQAPVQSQLVAKKFKPTDSRSGGQSGDTCGKCIKDHDGVCQSSSACHYYDMEGHFAKECRQLAPPLSGRICYHYE